MIASALIALMLVAQSPPPQVPNGLAMARQLYAAGAYEEALVQLATVGAAEPAEAFDAASQMRALCLLAMGRTGDARQALEALVLRRPQFRLGDADVSPQLRALFLDARRTVLPAAVRDLYARGRAAYEARRYQDALGQLRDVVRLLEDAELGPQAAALADYRALAEGFISLSEMELAALETGARPDDPASASAVTTVVVPATVVGEDGTTGPRVYSAGDTDVLPPVDVTRPMPPWYPPTAADASREHRGLLRIVIDERGYIESAILVEPVAAAYDPALLAATKYWKFRPAVHKGTAVKFAKMIEVVLAARSRN
jgi:tetratricopeptide (TPR) repeat protein